MIISFGNTQVKSVLQTIKGDIDQIKTHLGITDPEPEPTPEVDYGYSFSDYGETLTLNSGASSVVPSYDGSAIEVSTSMADADGKVWTINVSQPAGYTTDTNHAIYLTVTYLGGETNSFYLYYFNGYLYNSEQSLPILDHTFYCSGTDVYFNTDVDYINFSGTLESPFTNITFEKIGDDAKNWSASILTDGSQETDTNYPVSIYIAWLDGNGEGHTLYYYNGSLYTEEQYSQDPPEQQYNNMYNIQLDSANGLTNTVFGTTFPVFTATLPVTNAVFMASQIDCFNQVLSGTDNEYNNMGANHLNKMTSHGGSEALQFMTNNTCEAGKAYFVIPSIEALQTYGGLTEDGYGEFEVTGSVILDNDGTEITVDNFIIKVTISESQVDVEVLGTI